MPRSKWLVYLSPETYQELRRVVKNYHLGTERQDEGLTGPRTLLRFSGIDFADGSELPDMKPEFDLDLLRKFATGEGGRRTGALKRAGLLTWQVTAAGHIALKEGK